MKNTYLYVLLLPHLDKEYNLIYKIKFGYTENFKKRLEKGYLRAYGNVKIIRVYKGEFTFDDERVVKTYLSDYKLYGREWFKYCPEVLDFFDTYNTSDKLKEKINELSIEEFYNEDISLRKVNLNLIRCVREKVFNAEGYENCSIYDEEKSLKRMFEFFTQIQQLIYVRETYNINLEEISKYDPDLIYRYNVTNFVKSFFENKDPINRFQIIAFLDEKNLDNKELNYFLSKIPRKYRDSYILLGSEKIKELNYKESDIELELEKVYKENNIMEEDENIIIDKVKEEIYKTFKVGGRYTKADIKTSLRLLYDRLGYQKVAKASDLSNYFNMKNIMTKDKKNGFEILGKKS